MGSKIWLNLKDERSFVKYQELLHNSWHFKNEHIVQVLEHYKDHGEIKEYGEIHYLILNDLIELHFKTLKEKEKRAFLAYNKARLTTVYSSKAINTTLTFVASILTPIFSSVSDWNEVGAFDIVLLVVLLIVWVLWAIMNLISIKAIGSPATNFYDSLFSAISAKTDMD